MQKSRWLRLETSLYALGLLGFLLLMTGIIVHMTCTGKEPCPMSAWEKFAAYFGHACLVSAALCYCIMPFIRKE